MICHLENKDGYVYAYICWELVNEDGLRDGDIVKDHIYIDDLWIHEEYKTKFGERKIILDLSQEILNNELSENTKYVYWNNMKRGYKLSRLFDKEYFRRKK